MVDPGLRHKVVCITGANNARGIGAAVARAFAAQDAAVFIHYFRQAQTPAATDADDCPGESYYRRAQAVDAEHLLAEIRSRGGRAEACEIDFLNASAPAELMDRAEDAFGSVDVLVNNAALCEPDTFSPANALRVTAESHDRHFAVNGRAAALLMAEFARRHVAKGKQWGRIINQHGCSLGFTRRGLLLGKQACARVV